jgi:hypothetical protein
MRYHPFFPENFDRAELTTRVLQVLDGIDFFEKTKFKHFLLAIQAHHAPYPVVQTSLQSFEGALHATEVVLREEVVFATPEQFLQLCCAAAGKALVATCERYKLNPRRAHEFASRYARTPIQSSPLRMPATVAPHVVPDGSASDELDPEELLFGYASVGDQREELHYPLKQSTIDRIGPKCTQLFFDADEPYDVDDMIRAADACRKAPYARITLWGGRSTPYGPQFIEHFQGIKRVHLQACHPDVAQFLPDSIVLLHSTLEFENDHELDFLSRLPKLKWLALKGKKVKLDRFPALKQLEALSLYSPSNATLQSLPKFADLVSLNLQSAALSTLARIECKYLRLDAIRLKDLDSLTSIKSLQFLHLDSMRTIKDFPDLAGMHDLRRVILVGLKNLHDLSPIASAPNLRELLVYKMPQLQPEDFDCFKGHPSLKGIWTELGPRKDAAIMQSLGLTGTGCRKSFVFQ